MSRWAREHPEEMQQISRLPYSEQLDALREAILGGAEFTDFPRHKASETCAVCTHPRHLKRECGEASRNLRDSGPGYLDCGCTDDVE